MMVGVHALPDANMRHALHLTDPARLVANKFKLRLHRVQIIDAVDAGTPDAILDVVLWPPKTNDLHKDRFVHLHQIPHKQVPEFQFELARTEAARRACPIHRNTVKVLDFAAQIGKEFAASEDTLTATFLVEDKTHNTAFIAVDIQRADAHLTAFFRSLK